MPLKQRLTFTLIMCIGMGSLMSLLGMGLSMGWSPRVFHAFWLSVLPTIAFAFVFNLLIASNIASLLIKLGTHHLTDQLLIRKRTGQIRGWAMILVMCFTMSTRALIMNGTLTHLTLVQFISEFLVSLTLAYIVRGSLVKPIARKLTAPLAVGTH
ncbi:DUF2798 domain-containing protein [Lactiplantibacillus daowaiensis]|uniref:DUF2798 domain-containing protein n=1 Tax=Lactiplantibacillus daowaiensis TaxID=2559918 RepID=A0ABW1S3M7_9LACO|nr:DUF2798 domain-containing protein [Lactiplantibacillus daowaiensis]